MTPTQRRVHLVVWIVLGPALIGLVLVAVLTRPAQPVQESPIPLVEAGP